MLYQGILLHFHCVSSKNRHIAFWKLTLPFNDAGFTCKHVWDLHGCIMGLSELDKCGLEAMLGNNPWCLMDTEMVFIIFFQQQFFSNS